MIRKLLHRLLASRLSAKARSIRAEASREYRVACNRASLLERKALKHSRMAGTRLLSGTRRMTAPGPSKSRLCIPRVRDILGRISLVRQ